MADTDRVVYPDEVDDIKATAAAAAASAKPESGDSNSVEEAPVEVTPQIQMRNMITVPSNCPPGYQMGADGVCREVFD